MGDGDGVAQEMGPVEMKRAGDDDDAPCPIAVLVAASSDCGVDGQVEDMAISEPRRSREQKRVEASASEPAEKDEESVLAAVRIMLGTPHTATFFAAVGLSGMAAGIMDTFLFIRLEELGGTHVLCGVSRLVMCLAEVPFFYLSGPLIKRMGVRKVIALAQLANLVRFVWYSALREPWLVLFAEVLHGLTFAAMWAATIEYAHEIAPAHMRTTMQGAITGLHRGLGFGLGAVTGGILYAGLGASLCFGVSALVPSLALLLLAMPTAWPWFIKSMGRFGVWAKPLQQWTRGNGRAYEPVAEANDSTKTERPGRNHQQRQDKINPSHIRDIKQQTLDAWEHMESARINSAAAAAAFKMVGSKYTGGETGRT